jgi:tRNA G10  N-methylase Trm11
MVFDDIDIKFNLPFASDEEIKRHIEKKPLCKKIVNIVCRYKSKLERIANVDDDYYANQLELTLKPFIKVCNII